MRISVFALLLLVINSCGVAKKLTYQDIGDKYTSEYECKGQYVVVYRSTDNNKKLNGPIIRSASGLYDSTLHFTIVSTFEKGLLTGKDSIFREGKLIEVSTYEKGIKHGFSEEFDDSLILVSRYDHGIIDGNQHLYCANVLIKQSTFRKGIKTGKEVHFNSLAEIVHSSTYELDSTRVVLTESDKEKDIYLQSTGSTMRLGDFLRLLDYKGSIQVSDNLNGNRSGNPEYAEILHRSIIESKNCEDFSSNGYYYVIEQFGGDGIDQIWEDTWIVYKERLNDDFYYWKIED